MTSADIPLYWFGSSVLIGHVDGKAGPDVFYNLKDLEAGDQILIYSEDGDQATFVVDFDRSSGHYLSNVIVCGHLTD